MGEEDEFRGFDPRARWAYENNEEMEFVLQEAESRRCLKLIIDSLKESPKTGIEISVLCEITPQKVFNHIFRLRQKKYKIDAVRIKGKTVYELKAEPDRGIF